MPSQKITIGVIGGAEASAENYQLAYDVGKFIADNNAVLVCGGLSGTMEAASKGAFENGGTVIGFLPGDAKPTRTPTCTLPFPRAWALREMSWSCGPPTFSSRFPVPLERSAKSAWRLILQNGCIYARNMGPEKARRG
jgi:hypothetical protein